MGFITRGRGVTVHRADCINVLNDPSFVKRSIEVRWSENTVDLYTADLKVIAHDRKSLLNEITNILNEGGISLTSVKGWATKDNMAVIELQMNIKNKLQLENIAKKIKRLTGVTEIIRTNRNKGKK